jgi:hypothetical protein
MGNDTNNDPAPSIYRQAFEQVKVEIESVKEDDFVNVSLDILATVITVQGAYPEIVALRPQFVQNLLRPLRYAGNRVSTSPLPCR